MTQHTERINKMIQEASDNAFRRAASLELSGAMDVDDPWYCTAIVCAALKDVSDDYRPLSPKGREAVKNLEHF